MVKKYSDNPKMNSVSKTIVFCGGAACGMKYFILANFMLSLLALPPFLLLLAYLTHRGNTGANENRISRTCRS